MAGVSAVVHIARAFREHGRAGRRWTVDGVSMVTRALHLVSGKLERTIPLDDLFHQVERGLLVAEAEAEAPASSAPPASS